MTTEEQIEGNKLIAEFMGMKIQNNWVILGGKYNSQYDVSLLKYHSEWNSLMPVVEKIEKEAKGFILIHNSKCVINPTNIVKVAESKIEATWLAVVEFIKWHNANKQ